MTQSESRDLVGHLSGRLMKETGLMPALAVEAAAEDVRRDLVGGLSMVNARTGGGVSALLIVGAGSDLSC